MLVIGALACLAVGIAVTVFGSKPGDRTVRTGMDYYKNGNYAQAAERFEQALTEKTNYSEPLLYMLLGNSYKMTGNYAASIECQEKSLAAKKDYRGFINLGMTYRAAGDDAGAEHAYTDAIAFDPAQAEAYASLGALYIARNDEAAALGALEEAVALDPSQNVPQANLALARALNGDFAGAEQALAKAESLEYEHAAEIRARIDALKQEKP
ncbi:Tetratricopeptide TPR_1 repeat-containing protein [Treponema brennaborense DSM 12168]|uniref:Tetratricopeptide TPR_1 repeat-containing protein n=2 Tax=Treponema TaxID=157 RepID=F4LLU2_TREBD|nr:Tetratricopeptide TPR_1 repeat-containing protein [Treponema brennaborense DSM 12168]